MKKLLCKSLAASILATCGLAAIAHNAQAESLDVDFAANVQPTCITTKLQDGTLAIRTGSGVVPLTTLISRPDESLNGAGQYGRISITCNNNAVVSFTVPTKTSGPDLGAAYRTAIVYDGNDAFATALGEANTNNGGTGQFNLTAPNQKTLSILVLIHTENLATTIPAGQYNFRTTFNVTAN